MSLRVAHEAQPSAPLTAEQIRSLPPRDLATSVIAAQAWFGSRFDFAALGAVLARATDEELLALHRPTRSGR